MSFLYKLVDKTEIGFANDGLISLSRPIFEFKGSEGRIINFAKRIYEKYLKQGYKIKPSHTDLEEIREWINAYSSTYGKEWSDEHIISESMIMFCNIMQGFCGYFTTIDLCDSKELNMYLKKNGLKDKVGVLKLDDSIFVSHHWRTSNLEEPFIPFEGDPHDLQDYNGFTHPTKIIYNENYKDYKELLKIYNADTPRYASNWFNNLSKEYEWQQEKRIIFLLRSLEKNSSRTGCDSVYHYHRSGSYEEKVYCKLIDAIDYFQIGPRFIYLNVGTDKLVSYKIDELIKK